MRKLLFVVYSYSSPNPLKTTPRIGINPAAHLIGNVLEDEKVAVTVHVALGDNSAFGGNVVAGIHLDGIIAGPTVYLDGEPMQLPG
ncbi:MAG: hypothetical protein C5S40_07150 [ANME-2 cluster archaeon]|nr:hypothetical protein [ANME-2 cluster archaeon]